MKKVLICLVVYLCGRLLAEFVFPMEMGFLLGWLSFGIYVILTKEQP